MHIYHVQPCVVLLEILTYLLKVGRRSQGLQLGLAPRPPWEGLLGAQGLPFVWWSRDRLGSRGGLVELWSWMGEEGLREIIKKGSVLRQRFFQSKILEWENEQIKENCLSPPNTPETVSKGQSSE